jgi:hypothetical protein
VSSETARLKMCWVNQPGLRYRAELAWFMVTSDRLGNTVSQFS